MSGAVPWNEEGANLNTPPCVVESTAASSFIRCGRLPVFSSCCITPRTISSLISDVSTLDHPSAPGEGGGVCSYAARPLLLGRSANETDLVCDDAVDDLCRVDGVGGDGELVLCVRFAFLVGGGCGSAGADGLDMEGR